MNIIENINEYCRNDREHMQGKHSEYSLENTVKTVENIGNTGKTQGIQ